MAVVNSPIFCIRQTISVTGPEVREQGEAKRKKMGKAYIHHYIEVKITHTLKGKHIQTPK